MRMLLALIFALVVISRLEARGPGWALSMPTFADGGDVRIPIKVVVGSEVAVSPFTPDVLQDRYFVLWNPNDLFDCMVGTFSAFSFNDAWWTIPKSSGTWNSNNHQTFYLRMFPGASSTTIRGVLEKQ